MTMLAHRDESLPFMVFGEPVGWAYLDEPGNIEALFNTAHDRKGFMARLSVQDVINGLAEVGEHWRDPAYTHRRGLVNHLCGMGISKSVAEEYAGSIADLLSRYSLLGRIRAGFPAPTDGLDLGWSKPGSGGRIRAFPRGVVVQISAGNIFLGALDALIQGLLTRNVNILKLSSQDPVSLLFFMHSLAETDQGKSLARGCAVLSWERGRTDIESAVLSRSDTIVVYGADEAIEYYRKNAAPAVKVIGYGPKVSFMVIAAERFQPRDFPELARCCAVDICRYDQKACSCPQNIFIQCNNDRMIRDFMASLGKSISIEIEKRPPTTMSPDELAEIARERETWRFFAAQGDATVHFSPDNHGWSLVFRPDAGLRISPLNRFVYLNSFSSVKDLVVHLEGWVRYFQSAGLCSGTGTRASFAEQLFSLGVTRVCEPGHMLDFHADSPHDGVYPLAELVKWVVDETPVRPAPTSETITRLMLDIRRDSAFYRRHWEKVDFDGVDFFHRLPPLTRELFYASTPPESRDLLIEFNTAQPLIFGTGGSTGKPKYSYFTDAEFDMVADGLAYQYLSTGFSREDIAANLFVSGHLWSSFLAVDRAINKIGAANLPIAGQVDCDEMIQYISTFKPTVLFGLPSTLNKLLDYCLIKKIDLKVRMVYYAGENLTPAAAARFQQHWGVERIQSAGYAGADAGLIGYQCLHQSGGRHHLFSDMVLLEISDPEDNPVVADKTEGEILITTLYRRLMPLVRYRTGDRGAWVGESCPCRRADPVFDLLGRCDDRLQIGGGRLMIRDIEPILSAFPFLSGVYQFIAESEYHNERLFLLLETQLKQSAPPDFQSDFHKRFHQAFTDFSHSVRQGWIQDITINLVEPGAIPRMARTGKVQIVDDRRHR